MEPIGPVGKTSPVSTCSACGLEPIGPVGVTSPVPFAVLVAWDPGATSLVPAVAAEDGLCLESCEWIRRCGLDGVFRIAADFACCAITLFDSALAEIRLTL